MNRLRWVLFIFYLLTAIGLFAAAMLLPAVRSNPFVFAPLREIVIPPPAPIELTVYYSTEKEEWLEAVLPRFDTRIDGRPIELTMRAMGSREMYLAVLDGEQPDVISPAGSLQISILAQLSRDRFGTAYVNPKDQESCRSVVETPLVLVAWKERADVLLPANNNANLWNTLQESMTDTRGWEAYGMPEWGFVKYGQTNPLRSNSGFMAIVLMTYSYFERSSGLDSASILSDEDYQEWFLGFQNSVSNFGDSTGSFMRDMVAFGPSAYDIVAVYESTAIEQAANAVGRYGDLQIIYPPQTVMSDHPFCILNTEWVTPDKRRAAEALTDYLLSSEVQQIALMEHGFRPTGTFGAAIPLDQTGSPFQLLEINGLQVNLPPEVDLPSGDVLNTLLDFWSRNVEP